MNDDLAALESFQGVARLFPLPGLVFFPRAIQPLHIFEPRYRHMTADALAGDRLIALTLLRPGWENNYEQRPGVHSVACLGRIVADQLLPDGRYNLMLRGLARVRIIDEPLTATAYRLANVEILTETTSDDIGQLMELRAELADLILPRITASPTREQLSEFFHGELTLGHLCDLLTFALPLPPETKQGLLEELVITSRARLLKNAFQTLVFDHKPPTKSPGEKRFPPDFSPN